MTDWLKFSIYTGERCPLSVLSAFLRRGRWRSMRLFGVLIGRWYIGVQIYSRQDVRERPR